MLDPNITPIIVLLGMFAIAMLINAIENRKLRKENAKGGNS